MTAEQLRNSILQEAISGRLVPQDPNDEPATNLLIKTATFRKNALQNKLIRKLDAVWEPITDDEKFMELPIGWTWARLGELGMYRKGPFGSSLTKAMFVPKSDTSYKVYEQKNAIQKDCKLGEYYISKTKFDSMQSFIVNSGDIIVSCAGTIGETYVIPEGAPIGIINQALMRVKLYDDNLVDYWLLFFEYIVMTNTELKGNGSAIKNIPPFDILKNLAIPIPPLAEQQRIISKFKELRPIVEQYGKAQKELDELNAALPARLRQAILQEAISGRLVPQDPNDEAENVKVAEIEDTPFEIPKNWRWCLLGDLVDMVSGTSFKKGDVRTDGIRILRGGNIVNDELVLADDDVFLPDEYANSEKNIRKDDIIIVASTGSQKVIGKPALIRHNYEKTQIGAFLRIIRARDVKYIPFIWLIFKGMYYREHIRNLVKGTNINNIKEEYITTLPIPLPPLAEQKRIVAKIEELFEQIDKISK